MSQITFSDFNLPAALAQALGDMGYEKPTPIQAQAIPFVLMGRDLLATAQTGTGKTAAFAIPLLTRMLGGNKKPALILAPTRELAEQTHKVLQQLTAHAPDMKSAVIIGGTSYHHQIRALRANPAFVVATPGRLIDQMNLGNLKLNGFGALILDEADRMLDMGFAPQLEEIVALMPGERQTLLFSATLPDEIIGMAARYMKNPERIAIGEVSKPVERINQQVIQTAANTKAATLIKEIDKVAGSIIVFTRTKSRTEAVAKILGNAGHDVARIHGDRSQSQRREAIEGFRNGKYRILVATDIAARGIDVPHIRHVINYDLPLVAEDYIHRIGRTARAGAEGNALAFVTPEEQLLWARIHKLMYGRLPEGMERPARGKKTGSRSGYVGKKAFNNPTRGGKRGTVSKVRREEDDYKPRAQKAFRPRSTEDQAPNRSERRLEKFGEPKVRAKHSHDSFSTRSERPKAKGEKKSFGKTPRFDRPDRGNDRQERSQERSKDSSPRNAKSSNKSSNKSVSKSANSSRPAFGDRSAKGKPGARSQASGGKKRGGVMGFINRFRS